MSGLLPAAVLDLWERAERLTPVERALAMAAAVEPPASAGELAELPLGRRDARLLSLRARLTERALEAVVACPACGDAVEFAADPSALQGANEEGIGQGTVEMDGYVITWRPPDSRDVAAASETGDVAAAERLLLERCVTSIAGRESGAAGDALPPAVRVAVTEAMGDADPLAEVLVDLTCPACGSAFVADLDVAGFVWDELRARAQSLLREVDVLARVYGWSEADVLALGDERRAAYLRRAAEVAG